MNLDKKQHDWYQNVPKVELHLHLTGAIPYPTLWELIQKYGGDVSVPEISALEKKFRYRDFTHFLETWVWKNRFIREYEDLTLLSEAVARDLAEQNIFYAEPSFSLRRFRECGMEAAKMVEAIHTGFSRVPDIEIGLMIDLVRDYGPEPAMEILDEIKGLEIIGITIGGSEPHFPPGLFRKVYEKARELDFHTSVHAGEAAGPEGIWEAIISLKPDRIGHGTRAIEDPKLVNYLAENQIPLEICLLSNVRTQVVQTVSQHPVRHYFEKGIPLSINTDDPKMFGNSLAEEYQTLSSVFGFSNDEIRQLILQGIQTSWLSGEKKTRMTARFTGHPGWYNVT